MHAQWPADRRRGQSDFNRGCTLPRPRPEDLQELPFIPPTGLQPVPVLSRDFGKIPKLSAFCQRVPPDKPGLGSPVGVSRGDSDEVQDGEGETWGQGKDLWAHAMSFKKDSDYQLNMCVKNPHLDENRTDMI